MSSSDDSQLGPLVRLWGLTPSQLPSQASNPEDLVPFLTAVLQEAVPFIDGVAPKHPATGEPQAASSTWRSRGRKTYDGVSGHVEVYERVVPSTELATLAARYGREAGREAVGPESWACRRSVHVDEEVGGSAGWGEWVRSFKDGHGEAEEQYTPSIVGSRRARAWDCGGREKGVEVEEGGVRWGTFGLEVRETRHKLGGPLQDRAFAVVKVLASGVVGGRGEGGGIQRGGVDVGEILVVSIALDGFQDEKDAEFSKQKGIVPAKYTSVERLRRLPDGKRVEWIMATASDAKGVLPRWVQAKAVPGQIARDVQLFLKWIAKEREQDRKEEPNPTRTEDDKHGQEVANDRKKPVPGVGKEAV